MNCRRESIKSVIPEGAKRLSGIQKKIIVYWIPDLDSVSSGMTFGAASRLFNSLPGKNSLGDSFQLIDTHFVCQGFNDIKPIIMVHEQPHGCPELLHLPCYRVAQRTVKLTA